MPYGSWCARDWLDASLLLGEKPILDFFRCERHLSAFIASYNPNINRFDRFAFEYPLFGDFTCDLVVGDSDGSAFCFVEFEDARPQSSFARRGKKFTRAWPARFDYAVPAPVRPSLPASPTPCDIYGMASSCTSPPTITRARKS
jgi:hypothetical protein